jgi:hypothetical protein
MMPFAHVQQEFGMDMALLSAAQIFLRIAGLLRVVPKLSVSREN